MRDYYAILEIPADSSDQDIKKAYRRLAKKYHPDVNKATNAHEKFIEISEAYEILINHKEHIKYVNVPSEGQTYTTYRASDEFEKFREEAREKARQRAKMKYEEFMKHEEAFRESGLYDISLLIRYIFRFIVLTIPVLIIYVTINLILTKKIVPNIPVLSIAWIINIMLVYFLIQGRRKYFKLGNFYYNLGYIKKLFTERRETSQSCYYCRSKKADSVFYKLDLFKLKDIKLKTGGFRLHNISYVNKSVSIQIPRSKKAFIIHSINALIKVCAILACLIFLNITSLFWRVIAGMTAGGVISTVILLISRTKSNISYLFSYGSVIRIIVWIAAISLISRFNFAPFNISTSDAVYFVITSILLFDCVLMQFLNYALGIYSSKPVAEQYPDTNHKFGEGYRVYNDIPILSVVYPLFKWIFG